MASSAGRRGPNEASTAGGGAARRVNRPLPTVAPDSPFTPVIETEAVCAGRQRKEPADEGGLFG